MRTTRWLIGLILAVFLTTLAPALTLHVKTLTGVVYDIEGLGPADTIATLKQRIKAKSEIPVEQQRLIHAGKMLEDQRTLEEYGIRDEATIHLVLRLRTQSEGMESVQPVGLLPEGGLPAAGLMINH